MTKLIYFFCGLALLLALAAFPVLFLFGLLVFGGLAIAALMV